MLPLRFATRWRITGVLLLASVLVGALLPAWLFPQIPARSLIELDKWVHVAVFLFLAVWFCGQFARRAYWMVGLGLLAFGAFIEFCQLLTVSRAAELMDLYADAVGVAAGLGIALSGAGGWSLRMEQWFLERQRAG